MNSEKAPSSKDKGNPEPNPRKRCVCNEQVSRPKGKVCSDPHGNMGKPTEMIGSR